MITDRAVLDRIDEVIYRYARMKGQDPRLPQKCEPSGGKIKYNSRTKAQSCANELWEILSDIPGERQQYVYPCLDSGDPRKPHFHLTSMKTASDPETTPVPVAILIGTRRVLVHCGPPAIEPLPEASGMWVWKPRMSFRSN